MFQMRKLSLLETCSQVHCRILTSAFRFLAAYLHFALVPEAVTISTVCFEGQNLLFEVLGMQLVKRGRYLLELRLEGA